MYMSEVVVGSKIKVIVRFALIMTVHAIIGPRVVDTGSKIESTDILPSINYLVHHALCPT